MREVHEVMNTIQSFAAEDAHIIFGAVYDEAMGDDLRVTVVATGLGAREMARSQKPQLVVQRTGTDNQPVAAGRGLRRARQRPGGVPQEPRLDRRGAAASGVDKLRHPGVPAEAGGLGGASRARRTRRAGPVPCAGGSRAGARARIQALGGKGQ